MTMVSPSPPPPSPSQIPDMHVSSKVSSNLNINGFQNSSTGITNPSLKPRGNKILSQKVARALQVKTDTPAMTAALKAISNLTSSPVVNSSHEKNVADDKKQRNCDNKVIDARSVRAAIEQDALQQAILFQSELNNLLETVTHLKKSVMDIRIAASQVNNAIEASAVCTPLDLDFDKNIDMASESNGIENNKNNYNHSNDTFLENSDDYHNNEKSDFKEDNEYPNLSITNNDNSGLKKEQNLAFIIADAFRARNEAAYRAKTVETFLEKFDLSESDNYLLDHYSFNDIDPMNPNMSKTTKNQMKNQLSREANISGTDKSENYELTGEAFIQALKRVRSIREQLKSTFDTETYIHNHHETNMDEETNISYLNKGPFHANYDSRLGATSALRMMETLATKQERAYERLYDWLQSFLHLNDTSNEHIPTSSSALTLQGRRKDSLKRQQSSNIENGEDDDLMDECFSHPFVKSSLVMLKYVPAYYNHILELISIQRRSEVTRRFLLALTSGYNGITPIEMKAHDPVNYIGDMLAFIFRSFSVELELSRGLFSLSSSMLSEDDDDSNYSYEEKNKKHEENDHLYEKHGDDSGINSESTMTPSLLLSHAMSGVTRPLKSRISQVITSLARRADDGDKFEDNNVEIHQFRLRPGENNDDSRDLDTDLDEEAVSFRNRISALFSICGLFLFYHGALQKSKAKIWESVDNKSSSESAYKKNNLDLPLIEAIQNCLEEASTAYAASIRVYAAMLSSFAALTSKESESSLTNTLIAQISDVYVNSPGFADKLVLESDVYSKINRTLSLEFLCDTLLDAAILSCYSLDDAQSLKNAVSIAKKSGLSITCVEKWEKLLIDIESKLIEELIQIETDDYLDECGLGSVWKAFQRVEKMLDSDDDDVMKTTQFSTQPDLNPEILESAIKTFYSSLYKPPLPSFNSIKDLEGRNAARSKTSSNIATIYRRFYDGIKSEKGGYKDLSFLCHHPDKVQILLSS